MQIMTCYRNLTYHFMGFISDRLRRYQNGSQSNFRQIRRDESIECRKHTPPGVEDDDVGWTCLQGADTRISLFHLHANASNHSDGIHQPLGMFFDGRSMWRIRGEGKRESITPKRRSATAAPGMAGKELRDLALGSQLLALGSASSI